MQDDTAHLLVIDDDTRLRDLLQRYLSEQGFRVTTATDAADAPHASAAAAAGRPSRAAPSPSATTPNDPSC